MRSIFDAAFRYTPSYDTDVRKTFERLRREHDLPPARAIEAAKPRFKLQVPPEGGLTRARRLPPHAAPVLGR